VNDALFEDYLADRLSAADVGRLKQVLSSDRRARARFVEMLQEWELLAESARQITVNSCPVSLDDGPNRAIADGVRRRRPSLRAVPARHSGRRALGMLVPFGALAATLVVALWATRPDGAPEPLGSVAAATPGVTIRRGAEAIVAKVGMVVLEGDRLVVGNGAQARLEYPDRTALHLDQRTDLHLGASGSTASPIGKRVSLTFGRVTADVTKQPNGHPMVFSTPNSQAVVLGTKLTLEFTPTAAVTRLEVEHGLVGITDVRTRALVEVPGGHFATVVENAATVSRPLAAAAQTVTRSYRPGLRTTYFSGTDFKEPLFSRIEGGISTDLGLESMPMGERGADFSVRWSGYVQPLFSEKYLLTLRSDAGVRLFIDDKPVIDAWNADRTGDHQGSVMFDAGKLHSLRVEYRQPKSGMLLKLSWASPSQKPEVIPVERLSSDQ
jgi:hypothetical protein